VTGVRIRSGPSPASDRTAGLPAVQAIAAAWNAEIAGQIAVGPDFQPAIREVTRRQPAVVRVPPELRRALGEDRQGWRGADCSSVQPEFGLAGNHVSRLLRAKATGLGEAGLTQKRGDAGHHGEEPASSFRGEQAALCAFHGAKIEAMRRSKPRDLAAALRVLFDDQHSALQELARRRRAFRFSARERRRAENSGRRVGERRAIPS
jgi:hypothetical protein